jgi:DNA-directed RNA polymerase specialized sigma24 family protein
MSLNECLEIEYPHLVEASLKITSGHELHLDLLHYCIEDLCKKPNAQAIVDSGGIRFYIVRMMMTQFRSVTGPFYKMYMNHWSREIEEVVDEKEEHLDVKRVEKLLQELPWYDHLLFKTFVEGDHSYSSLSRDTGIPRTSISLTINRVRRHIKKNL